MKTLSPSKTSWPALVLLAGLAAMFGACATGGGGDATERETVAAPAPPEPEPGSGSTADDPTTAIETPPADELSPAAAFADDPAALKRGSDLFRALCTGYCHSVEAGEDTDASYLFDCDWSYGGSDREIFGVVSEGIPDTRMQGFGGKLPDEELWKIVAFVQSKSGC